MSKKVLHVSNTEFDLSATTKSAAMKELPTAEELLKPFTYKNVEGFGNAITPEMTELLMHTYAKAVADELAGRIKENDMVAGDFCLNERQVDLIVEKLKSELS